MPIVRFYTETPSGSASVLHGEEEFDTREAAEEAVAEWESGQEQSMSGVLRAHIDC